MTTLTIDSNESTPPTLPGQPINGTLEVKTKPSLRDYIVTQLQEKVNRSKELQQKIANSKTKPKRDLYTKKIGKNNEDVANLILALQKIDHNEKIKNETKPAEQTDSKLA